MNKPFDCDACEQLLFEFHEGKLESHVSAVVDEHLKQCDECSLLLKDIWQMGLVSTRWQEQTVPALGRVTQSNATWQMPQIFATAASILALVIVLTDTHFETTDNGITLKVGRDAVSAATLNDFQVAQKTEFDDRFQRLTAQQVATNQLMLRSVLETSRQERQEDFATLVGYWNATQAEQIQRSEENFRYLLASQAEDERDIRQLSNAFHELNLQRGSDM